MADSAEQKRILLKKQMLKEHLLNEKAPEEVKQEEPLPEDPNKNTIRQASWAETSPLVQGTKNTLLGVTAGIPFTEQIAGIVGALRGKGYANSRDKLINSEEMAQYENPGLYAAGNVAGGIGVALAPELVAGKVLQGAKVAQAANAASKTGSALAPGLVIGDALQAGNLIPKATTATKIASAYKNTPEVLKQAGFGAIYGASKSGVDLTKDDLSLGDIGNYAFDITKPTAYGGLIGMIPAAIAGTITKTPLKNTGYGKLFKKSYEEGVDLSSGDVINKLAKEKISKSNEIAETILGNAKKKAIAKAEAIGQNADVPLNLKDIRQFAEEELGKLSPDLKSNQQLIAEVQNELSQAFKDKTITTKVPKIDVTKTEVPYEPSSLDKLREKIADQKLKDADLGINARYDINKVKNELGQDRLKVNKYVDDVPKASPEKLINELDSQGQPTGYKVLDVTEQQPSIDTSASVTGIHPDIPASGGYSKFTPEQTIEEYTKLEKHPEMYTLKEADEIRKNLSTLIDQQKHKIDPMGGTKSIAYDPLNRTRGKLSELINESTPEISKLNKELRNTADVADALGMGKMDADTIADLSLKDQFKINDPIRELANPASHSVEAANKQMINQSKFMEKLQQLDPASVEKFKRTMNISEDLDLGQALGTAEKGITTRYGAFQTGLKHAAGKGGIALRSINKGSKYLATTPEIATAYSPEYNEKTEEKRQQLSEMSPEQMMDIASRLKGKGIDGVANKIEKAAQSKDPVQKAQAEFIVKQNPTARKQIENPNEE